ncbi:hypothetical protein ES703_76310 [subsurface metagenome]
MRRRKQSEIDAILEVTDRWINGKISTNECNQELEALGEPIAVCYIEGEPTVACYIEQLGLEIRHSRLIHRLANRHADSAN